jgi:4-amino-4-deoxy-L-arabinose transferase-like glycosyltransferase
MASLSHLQPAVRSLTPRATGVLLSSAIVLWIIAATAVAATRAPWSNEAWSANPAVTLAEHGYLGTQILESQKIWLRGVDQHLYWMMPTHALVQAAWYRVVGFGLVRQRLLSVAFGAGALVSWFVIILSLSGERFIALLAVCVIGFERNFLAAAGNGRMDMMAASLGTMALASYFLLRRSRPRTAVFMSHALAAAGIFTHPCGLIFAALLVLLTVYLDRQRLRLRDLCLALLPYLFAAALWSLYIAQAPADFISQFAGNISGFAGEYTHQERFAGLRSPLLAFQREWSLRYSPAFGFSGLEFKAAWLEASWLLGVVLATFAALVHSALRKQQAIRVLLVAAATVLLLMTILDGMKFQNYLVYSVPFLAALFATAAGLLLQSPRRNAVFLGVFLLLLAIPQLKTVLWQVRANPLKNEFQVVADYLRQNSGPGDRIIAGGEFAYVFGFTGAVRDDVRLGYYSGLQPLYIVTNGWYRDWLSRSADGDPQLHAYLQHRLTDDYEVVFRKGEYIVCRNRSK